MNSLVNEKKKHCSPLIAMSVINCHARRFNFKYSFVKIVLANIYTGNNSIAQQLVRD